MLGLGVHSSLLHLADFGRDRLEVALNRLECQVTGLVLSRLGKIDLGQFLDTGFRGSTLVLGSCEVEFGSAQKLRWLGAFEKDEILVLANGGRGCKIQLFPEPIQLSPPCLVKH